VAKRTYWPKTHFADHTTGKTFCGLPLTSKRLTTDSEDECNCDRCQASDTRRMLESYQREQAALPPEKRDNYEG